MSLNISKYLELLFPNYKITQRWDIPVLVYSPYIVRPYGNLAIINDNKKYRRRVVNYYYTSLTEKWLHGKKCFRKLFRYFMVSGDEKHRNVTLVSRMEDVGKYKITDTDEKYILKYIEKHLLSKKLIKQILNDYVMLTKVNWYDLLHNKDTIMKLFCHVLKKIMTMMIRYSHK
jgi:hypothetical protein